MIPSPPRNASAIYNRALLAPELQLQAMWSAPSSVAEPEQLESTQLAQQYEASLLSDQAVHDAADLSDGAAAATRDGNGAAAVRPEDPRRAAFVPSPMQLEFPLDMLPPAAPSGPRRSRRHCCALACCRGLSGAVMGLSVGVVLTFVVSSLELELDYAQLAAGSGEGGCLVHCVAGVNRSCCICVGCARFLLLQCPPQLTREAPFV